MTIWIQQAALALTLAAISSAALAAPPVQPKKPLTPATGWYDEISSREGTFRCNTFMSPGQEIDIKGIKVPTFSVEVYEDDEDEVSVMDCMPRIIMGAVKGQGSDSDFVKTISPNQALCLSDGEVIDVAYSKSSLTWAGKAIEVTPAYALGVREVGKVTLKPNKNQTCGDNRLK